MDRTPFELLARTENELEELAHDCMSDGYGSKQRIVLSVTGNSRTVGGAKSLSSGAEAREISDMTHGFDTIDTTLYLLNETAPLPNSLRYTQFETLENITTSQEHVTT